MKEYEIHVSGVTMFVEAKSEEQALSDAELLLMETVWSYDSIEVM
jgi:hypothetical protein